MTLLELGKRAKRQTQNAPLAVNDAFDLAAMAAFFWALVVTYGIWRKRRGN